MSEQAIYNRLNAEVTALGGRIYPMVLPQTVGYPAVTFQRISATRYSSFGVDDAPVEAVIQVDVYGRRNVDYSAHLTVADAVQAPTLQMTFSLRTRTTTTKTTRTCSDAVH